MLTMRYAPRFGLAAVLALTGCGGEAAEAAADPPAVVEETGEEGIGRITLTEHAAERLALETAEVERAGTGLAVPFAAVFWDSAGQAWTYTNPEPLVFVRQTVAVERIDGDRALLTDGPAAGSSVVIVGVAELYGAETGVGGGH
jgi:hypothetical protein